MITVQLTDAFFEDPLAVGINYVLPLELVDVDSRAEKISGTLSDPSNEYFNKSISGYWETGDSPKDFTLFGIKFVNPLEGTFYHRGKQYVNSVLDKEFHEEDMESNQTADLTTTGLHEVEYNRMGEFTGDNYHSKLTFDDDGEIVVSAPSNSPYTIEGTGKYYESDSGFAEEHGLWLVDPTTGEEIAWLTVVLDYEVYGLQEDTRHHFMDTLVYRNNNVTYEEFSLIEPSSL